MIKVNNSDVLAMYINGCKIISIYVQNYKVWPSNIPIDNILSCFYNGYWIDEYPWTDDTPWTD